MNVNTALIMIAPQIYFLNLKFNQNPIKVILTDSIMVNFICQLDWDRRCSGKTLFLGASVSVVSEENWLC